MKYIFVVLISVLFDPFCRAKKPGIQLPKYHYIDHRIEILEQKDNYNHVVLYEKAAARYSPFPVMAAK